MHRDELRKLLSVIPFRPFRVYTTDGTAVPVWHPDFAYLSPDGRTLFVYQKNNEFSMLDVVLIPRFAFDAVPDPGEAEPVEPPPTTA